MKSITSLWQIFLIVMLVFFLQAGASAKVDLVTLPKRDSVQLTIYNSADLTLVNEQRTLTLKKGMNRLQFSWANTLIDPTSLDILPKREASHVDLVDLSFPSGVSNLGVWHLKSGISSDLPFEISYLTSGLSWRAFYMATLAEDEKEMMLEGYVRVLNESGEDYEKARVRLLVGKINLIDRIGALAKRKFPYGRPSEIKRHARQVKGMGKASVLAKRHLERSADTLATRPKEIKKEGISEYFLYTIEGKETIPSGWSKRLISFKAEGIPVTNLFKYDPSRFGERVVRFLSFKNDNAHSLGATPIPGGKIMVYRHSDHKGALTYEGRSTSRYIPVGEDVELNLGETEDIIIRPRLMAFETLDYSFDKKGNVAGWDEVREFEIDARNTRGIPAQLEITRSVGSSSWEIEKSGDFDSFEKVDLRRIRFRLTLSPGQKRTFRYSLTIHHGNRQDR